MSWKVVVLVATGVMVVGVAMGAVGGSDGVTFCAGKGGDLSLAKKGKCSKGEKKLTIAKRGPQGEQGPPGADGTPEDLAPEPVQLVSPAAGPTSSSCSAAPGRFCGTSPTTSCSYTNPGGNFLPAGYRKDSGGWVHLQGAVDVNFSGAGCAAPPGAFYLPAGYRPAGGTRFAAADCFSPSAQANVTVQADGLVNPATGVSSNCVNLDGIEFHP